MGWSPNPQRHHQVGVEPIIGTGLAPDPHLAPLTTGHLHAWLEKMVLRGPRETCSALWTHTLCCWEATKKAELTPRAMQTDGWTEPAFRWDLSSPAPPTTTTRSQGRPESAGLQPEAGHAAATVTNWRVAVGQHIVFCLRLQTPLCLSLSPLAQTRRHLEKQEVCVGRRLLTGQPWPFA